MCKYRLCCLAAIALAIALANAEFARAQITGVSNSDVEGYFGATSDTFQQAETTIPPWGVSGPGFYPISGLPAVPALYPTFPNPVIGFPSNIQYAAPFAHAPASAFTDGQTAATYSIIGGFNGAGLNTSDAYVDLGVPGAVPFTIKQPPTATGYAYEQVNFAMSYTVGPGGLIGGLPGPRPYSVAGSFATGGWVQFAAQVNYWFIPAIPGTTITGPTQFLGSLDYNLSQNSVSGPFSTTVNFTSSGLLGATGTGFLFITGDAFVAGDPFELNVVSVPEPSTFALAGLGVGLLFAVRKRR